MSRSEDRCDHVYEHDAGIYKPYCCWREEWRGGKCVWHAAIKGKPAKLLRPMRVAGTASTPDESADRWLSRGGERLDGAILRSADLTGMQFRGCTFFGSDLSGADLSGVDCSRTDFRRSNCAGLAASQGVFESATFRNANLSNAELKGVNLRDADLKGANLEGANLRDANLQGADLRRTNLQEADLQGADLQGANCYEAEAAGVSLVEADCRGTNFEKATLSGAHAMRSDLRDAKLAGADARGANLANATLAEGTCMEVDLSDANLTGADLTEVRATGADLSGAQLERARMTRAECYDVDFSDVSLYGVVLGGAQVNEATTFDRHVVYDPVRGDEGEGIADGGSNAGDVDPLTKAIGSYRILEQVARENELTDLRTRSDMRRRDLRRQKHRQNGEVLRWARSTATAVTVGYGEKPGRVVATGLAVVVGSALVYPLGLVERADGEALTYSTTPLELAGVLSESLYFSAMAFTTGATGYQPVGFGRLLAAVEGVLGVFLFALLVYAFARRASR